MKGVRTACISAWDDRYGVALYLNLDVLQWNHEPMGDGGPYLLTVGANFVYKGKCVFMNSRKVQVDQWKSLKEVILADFVDEMYTRMGLDFMCKADVINLVDMMFKNTDDYCTPLVLAAEEGNYHTVH